MIKTDPPQRYVLRAADGRAVTYDTRTGPALTASRALCYVWLDPSEAEASRSAYEVAVGVSLTVQRQPALGGFTAC